MWERVSGYQNSAGKLNQRINLILMSSSKWNTEPNNYQGIQNCAVILRAGTFDDVDCIQQYGFICEQNLEGIIETPN